MSRQLRNLRAAREELAAAVRWFEEQRVGLGAEFYDEVVATTDRLQAFPEGGAPISSDRLTRRVIVSRFPYHIVYRLSSTELVVLAVAHFKTSPQLLEAPRIGSSHFPESVVRPTDSNKPRARDLMIA